MATKTTTKSTPTTSYPLTTQFKPPESCATQYWFPTVYPGFTASAVFVNGAPILVEGALKQCWPANFDTVGGSSPTFYSPGICPSGYATAAQSYLGRTMYAYCCLNGYKLLEEQAPQNLLPDSINPSEFTRDSNTDPVCFQTLDSAIVVEYQSINGEIYTTDLRRGHSVIQLPIRVKYEATDFSRFPLDAQPTDLPVAFQKDLEPFIRSGLVTIASETVKKTTSGGLATSTVTDPKPSQTSSGGAQDPPSEKNTATIAIAVGVTVSVIIVLAVAGYFLFSWRRKKRNQENGIFPAGTGPYKQHQNNDSQFGGIQDYPDQAGGIALAETGGWSKGHQ
ncbi:hypothetical protein ABW20_dc0110658 [Dactylellina cionopaga]|nr:hypothetical protein ABW20_dc0110658 [Dactylellina cionopaga]